MSEVKRYVAKSAREYTPTDAWANPNIVQFVEASDYDALAAECERYEDGMRAIACNLSAGGYNAAELSAEQLLDKVNWGLNNFATTTAGLIDTLRAERDAALAELENCKLAWGLLKTELSALKGGREAVYNVAVTGSLDEIDAPVWPFINAEAQKVGAERGRIETYRYDHADGGVVVIWDSNKIHGMAVTIRDDMNRTRCIRMLTAPPAQGSAWVPEGWKMVPVVITDAMAEEFGTEGTPRLSPYHQAQSIWDSVLAAAPTPGASDGEEGEV